MATLQEKIKNRLYSLKELDDVTVKSTDELRKISITHRLKHAADFKFMWIDGTHYVGYFIGDEGSKSQGIVSLWSALDAIKFTAVYATLVELRAKR